MADTQQRHLTEGEAGLHRDGEKPRLADYLDWELILEAGRIAAINNAKSADYPGGKYPDLEGGIPNYKGGIRVTKLLDSAMRHLIAVILREDEDPESKHRHLAHLMCNVSMASWTIENRPDLDDRMLLPKSASGQHPAPDEEAGLLVSVPSSNGRAVDCCPHCGIRVLRPNINDRQLHSCAACGKWYWLRGRKWTG